MLRACPALLLMVAFAGCAEVDSPNAEVVLPIDYRTGFIQVRGCRDTIDHGLMTKIAVRLRPELAATYEGGPYPFPTGSLVVKEEYDGASACQSLTGYTVMRKESPGYFPAGGDWQYFNLDSYGTVLKNGRQPACANCHAVCGAKRDRICTTQ